MSTLRGKNSTPVVSSNARNFKMSNHLIVGKTRTQHEARSLTEAIVELLKAFSICWQCYHNAQLVMVILDGNCVLFGRQVKAL